MTQRIRISNLKADLASSMASLRGDASRVDASRLLVEQALRDGGPHYGINTGFGALASERISDGQLVDLQRNILLSHCSDQLRCNDVERELAA